MSATPLLRPMFSFSGWIIDRIDIDWKDSLATVFLRRDGRVQQQKCSQCGHPMGKMRENEHTVLDLPLGTLDVQLHFTVYQGRCSRCQHIETITPPGLSPKSHLPILSARRSNRAMGNSAFTASSLSLQARRSD